MKLPRAKRSDRLTKKTQLRFGGYDALGTEGAICDMENLTTEYFPELAVRRKNRMGSTVTVEDPNGLGAAGDTPCWIDGRDLCLMTAAGCDTVQSFLDAAGDCTLAQLGDYLTAWPEGKYYDIVSGEAGSIGCELEDCSLGFYKSGEGGWNQLTITHDPNTACTIKAGDAITISNCELYPECEKAAIVRSAVVESPATTTLYFDDECWTPRDKIKIVITSGLSAGSWYVYMDDRELGLIIKDGAALDGSGTILFDADEWGDNATHVFRVNTTWAGTLEAEVLQWGHEHPWAQVSWLNDQTGVTVTESKEQYLDYYFDTGDVSREIPALSIVFSHDNRLFGAAGDTVYVSKLGDPFNWNVFDGTAMDSYAVDTGTPGEFTGGASFGGCPRFFKADRVFTLYGDYPAEYQLVEKRLSGVMSGSGKSLAVGNDRLFYLSGPGVMMYTGAKAVSLAAAFGTDRYKNGVGASDGEKYYLCMTDRDTNARTLFVYDAARGLWTKEDAGNVLYAAYCAGAVWTLAADGVITAHGRPVSLPAWFTDEGAVEWFAEFGDIAEQAPEKKRIVKLILRAEPEEGAEAVVKLMYDSDGIWRRAGVIHPGKKRSVLLPLIPRRYDHLRLRIEGKGMCRISSLSMETAAGSER